MPYSKIQNKIVKTPDFELDAYNKIVAQFNLDFEQALNFDPWIPEYYNSLKIENESDRQLFLELFCFVILKFEPHYFMNRLINSKYLYFSEVLTILEDYKNNSKI